MTPTPPTSALRLRPLVAEDRARIRPWIADPAVRAWWGPPSSVEAEIAIALETASAICRIIEAEGAPIGYAHAVDGAFLASDPSQAPEPGVWQCAFLIGSEAHRGLGLGALALARLATEVLTTTLAIACDARIPVRNEAAVRQIEAQGFRWHHVEADPSLGPVWIMRRARSVSHSPVRTDRPT